MKSSFVVELLVYLTPLLASVEAHSWVHCVDYDQKTGKCKGLPLWEQGRQIQETHLNQGCAFDASLPNCNQVCGSLTQIPQSGFQSNLVSSVTASVKRGGSIFITWPSDAHIDWAGHPSNNDGRAPTEVVILKAPNGVRTGAKGNTKPLAKWKKIGQTMKFGKTCMSSNNWLFTGENGVTDPHGLCGGHWTVPRNAGCGRQMFSWMWMYSGGTYDNHVKGAQPLNYDASSPAYLSCFYIDIKC